MRANLAVGVKTLLAPRQKNDPGQRAQLEAAPGGSHAGENISFLRRRAACGLKVCSAEADKREGDSVVAAESYGFRNSTLADNSGVRCLSGAFTCTLTCNVPFARLASGAISAT